MIKSELDFGLDNFGKQKTLNEPDSIAQLISNILFMRPGQMPSMPHIGIDIHKYLYEFDDALDTDALREEIALQCASLVPYIDMTGIQLFVVDYRGESILMLIVPVFISSGSTKLLMGMKKNNDRGITFNYQYEDNLV